MLKMLKMLKKLTIDRCLTLVVCLLILAPLARAEDWTDWRGPLRDGVSTETNLPSRWSAAGENLLWKAPYGSRSAPVVFGDRLYLLNPVGQGESVQERVLCLNADTGKLIWEHRFNVFHTDVPPHRVAWASPVVDPTTGNVYAFGVDGNLIALSKDGKVLWDRSLTEEFGAITTHGARTVSPVIEDDLIVLSTLTAGWGDQARGNNRYFAFDKATGATVWVSSPQTRHWDTNYSSPVGADVAGKRLLIMGGSDGVIHALKAHTGESVWKYEMSKRAILTNVVLKGTTVYVTHSEENFDTSEMGQLTAIDATATGAVDKEHVKWRVNGTQGGFSSPVIDGDRLYQLDNSAILTAFDLGSGKKLWEKILGTIQKGSPVFADGKLYLGTENGKFYILKPSATGVEVLDEDEMSGTGTPAAIIASPAVARGHVYFASMDELYCIGNKARPAAARKAAAAPAAPAKADSPGEPTWVQVRPAEVLLKPGERVRFQVRLYDGNGRFVREEPAATWTVDGLKADVPAGGEFVAPAEPTAQAGTIKATVGTLSGTARVRVLPAAPWTADFESNQGEAPPRYWINSTGKYVVRDLEGSKVLVKLADNPFTKRGRLFFGPAEASEYTVEADVRATEKRRQMGDAGVIAQRYVLVLFGNTQRLELQAWQANSARSTAVPFAWSPDTWYHLKLRVDNLTDGTTQVRGKAWPTGDTEPEAWSIEKLDRMPHRHGSPGLYADAPFEVFFDNVKVSPNSPPARKADAR